MNHFLHPDVGLRHELEPDRYQLTNLPDPVKYFVTRKDGADMPLILLVDDDAECLRSLSKYLNAFGLGPSVVSSGIEALEFCRERRPDLILLDWCLGAGLSGSDTLKVLKKNPQTRDVPVIVISGLRMDSADERAAMLSGAQLFIAKSEITERPGPGEAFERHVRALLPKPLAVASSRAATLMSAPETAPAPAQAAFEAAYTVLVIDDEPESAELLGYHLKPLNCRVLHADTGVQGLRLAAAEMPDLVVLDLHLGGMDGREVCSRLREQDHTLYLPVLMLSGDRRLCAQIDLLSLGADDYMLKTEPGALIAAKALRLIKHLRYLEGPNEVVRIGGVALDSARKMLMINDQTLISLTPIETGICALLAGASGRFVTKETVFKKLRHHWSTSGIDVVKVHVSHIRTKMSPFGDLIIGRKHEGYRLDVEAAKRLVTSGTQG